MSRRPLPFNFTLDDEHSHAYLSVLDDKISLKLNYGIHFYFFAHFTEIIVPIMYADVSSIYSEF